MVIPHNESIYDIEKLRKWEPSYYNMFSKLLGSKEMSEIKWVTVFIKIWNLMNSFHVETYFWVRREHNEIPV